MAKLTGFNRKRIGHRNYVAVVQSPPSAQDEYGHIDYEGTWTTVVSEWPCELVDVGGGEVIDGLQTKATTEKIAIGDATQLKSAGVSSTAYRLVIDGTNYGITAIRDVSGDGFSYRVELRSVK